MPEIINCAGVWVCDPSGVNQIAQKSGGFAALPVITRHRSGAAPERLGLALESWEREAAQL
ncbi:hypothetical protein GCM10011587_27410 [Pyruvatibacter mobilis]|nr:hypothetical protein GCM10011587_27410 [Pyruvatibacter mobilis]